MQKLYSFSYPCSEVARVDDLYLRGFRHVTDAVKKAIYIEKDGFFNTCTYYNAFSLEKWRKYTDLNTLILVIRLMGHFRLDICTKYLTAGDYLDKKLYSRTYELKEIDEIKIDLTQFLNQPGLLYYEITAVSGDCVFLEASYQTEAPFPLINIGTVICTYKRESYIKRYADNFKKCTSRQHIRTFIADNGQTLPFIEDDRILVFPNRNYGGAGGFARGMLEIKAYNKTALEKDKIDYVLLMDDDIVIDFNIFEKLISFISLRKKCFSNYFFAGGMASLDYPYLQYEKYSSWRGDGFVQFGANYDLRDINTIVTNEREDRFKNCSVGWWFSCFSAKMIEQNNYPFPCFFRGDDMEFTIRNGARIITLNGINVWHEPFYKKYSVVSENYYLIRNSMVINTLYLQDMRPNAYVKYLMKRFLKAILTYDYRSAEMLIKAWEDYCKGIKFFMETEPEEYNAELSEYNYIYENMEDQLEEFRFDDINGEIYNKADKGPVSSLIRHITFNGYFIPTCFYKRFGMANVGFSARYINFYRTKRVYNFDPFARKGYFTEIDKKKAIKLAAQFLMMSHYFKHNFKKIRKNYQSNFWRVQTEEFWRKYLGICSPEK